MDCNISIYNQSVRDTENNSIHLIYSVTLNWINKGLFSATKTVTSCCFAALLPFDLYIHVER